MVAFQRVQLEAVATLLDRVEEETDALARAVFRHFGTKMSEVGVRVPMSDEEARDMQVSGQREPTHRVPCQRKPTH